MFRNPENIILGIENLPSEIESIELATLLESNNFKKAKLLGEGSNGLVIQLNNLAVKIGFHFGIDLEMARMIATVAYPEKVGPKARVQRQLAESLKQLQSYQKQVVAHHIGNRARPDLIDSSNISLVTYNSIACGMTLPLYEGEFMSISNPKFGFTKQDRTDLEAVGVQIDDLQHRKNGVILSNGSRRIFDLGLKIR